jgi:DNA-directed RNA polymerase subunit RPC12/RpoP
MLLRMECLAASFYASAAAVGCHGFLEIAGVMGVFLEGARRAHEQGEDFFNSSEPNSGALLLTSADTAYLGEKLRCIFGNAFLRNPSALARLVGALTHRAGWWGMETETEPPEIRCASCGGQRVVAEPVADESGRGKDRLAVVCRDCGSRACVDLPSQRQFTVLDGGRGSSSGQDQK